jgi:hypothetical protein
MKKRDTHTTLSLTAHRQLVKQPERRQPKLVRPIHANPSEFLQKIRIHELRMSIDHVRLIGEAQLEVLVSLLASLGHVPEQHCHGSPHNVVECEVVDDLVIEIFQSIHDQTVSHLC